MKAPKLVTEALLRRWPLPKLDGALGKDDRGQVLVVGGSDEVPGAVILAAIAALRAGAGKLQIATSKSVARDIAIAVPEARVIGLRAGKGGEIARGCARALAHELEGCDALLVGPGMFDNRGARELVKAATGRKKGTLVVDAAALEDLAELPRAKRPMVITPHAGEMATMWGVKREEVLAAPEDIAREVASELGVVVALKGAETIIAAPDGEMYRNTAGNLGLGTSGSGDTLSGVIAGLAARGADPLQAAVWGVHVHARAGDALARRIAPLGFLARELLHEIPPLLAKLSRRR